MAVDNCKRFIGSLSDFPSIQASIQTLLQYKNSSEVGSFREDTQAIITLPESELQHASKALRCKDGDRVSLFDPELDIEAYGQLSGSKLNVNCLFIKWAPLPSIILGNPESKILDFIIEKSVEIGVQNLTIVDADRSQGAFAKKRLDRLQRIKYAALKQSFSFHSPELIFASSFSGLINKDSYILCTPENLKYLEEHFQKRFSTNTNNKNSNTQYIIGPEGGFSTHELCSIVDQGATPIVLSPNILRVETAVIAALVSYSMPNFSH